MKRREFIQTSCKYALLCASPLALSTLQSCEDVDADYTNNNEPITPPVDGGSDSGSNDGGSDSQGGSGTYVQIDISSSDLQSLLNVGGSAITPSNAADPNGFLLYRASDTEILAFTRKCTHAGSSVGAFVNGVSRCPSHGAQFDLSGSVVGGPARSALKKYTTSLDGSILKVFYSES
tara:strand:- start:320 stop:850 length:531 start_codon:yes stop_codon:yes gene_type:complete